jgi:hypothetical protein
VPILDKSENIGVVARANVALRAPPTCDVALRAPPETGVFAERMGAALRDTFALRETWDFIADVGVFAVRAPTALRAV